MFKIFNGSVRGFGENPQQGIYAEISVDFRKQLRYFKGAKLAVFMAITLHADAKGRSSPSLHMLENETGYDGATISQALTELCKLEVDGKRVLLAIQERAKGKFVKNRYLIFPSTDEIAEFNEVVRKPRRSAKNAGKTEPGKPSTDFPNTAKPNTVSPNTENAINGIDPVLGNPSLESNTSLSPTSSDVATDAPEAPDKAVEPEPKRESGDSGKLYLSLGNNRYQGSYAPYSEKKPAGTYLDGSQLPADAVIVPPPGKVLAEKAKQPKAPKERKPPDPVFRWVCAYMGVDVDATWTSPGHEAHSMKGYIVHEEKARLKQATPLTDEQLAACAERLSGFPVWYPTQCKDCNLPMHRRFQTWIGKWYLVGRPGNAPAPKRAADPNCPHCYGDGVVTTEDDRGYRTSKTCACVKEVRNG